MDWRAGQRLTAERMTQVALNGLTMGVWYRDSPQSIPSGSTTPIAWTRVDNDVQGIGTGSQIMPLIPGWYMCKGGASFQSSTGGDQRVVFWRKNGTNIDGGTHRPIVRTPEATGTQASPGITARNIPVFFDGVSDYFELCVFHNAGTSLNTVTEVSTLYGDNTPHMTLTYVGPEI